MDRPDHQRWLGDHFQHLLSFGRHIADPEGGAAWLTDSGERWPEKGVHTWLTARAVHVYSLGAIAGIPGSRPIAEQAMAGLTGRLHDAEHGGWFSQVNFDGTTPDEKAGYAHAFVILAGSSAKLAGIPGGEALLAEAIAVFNQRFWDEEHGMALDTWNRAFSVLDSYRGINANMHTLEAFLAAFDATGDPVWLERGARIASFAIAQARANGWRLPEHFDASWKADLELNADRVDDPFKPYGATVGHGLEWARLFLHLEAAGATGADWLGSARELFNRAITDGWHADGADGLVYTTDWQGRPVVRDRMHWVAAEAAGAAAVLYRRTGEQQYADWYATVWDYIDAQVLDHDRGSWRHQLDAQNRPADSVWPGKPDLYHAAQATLLPRLPVKASIAGALVGHPPA